MTTYCIYYIWLHTKGETKHVLICDYMWRDEKTSINIWLHIKRRKKTHRKSIPINKWKKNHTSQYMTTYMTA